jgi:hypothetical protein
MRLLLDGQVAPITETIGFLELPVDEAIRGYTAWQESIHAPLGRAITLEQVSGTLDQVLSSLLPLTSIISTRELFVPTASVWVAFFDNGWRGSDAAAPMSYLAQALGCRGLRMTAIPDTMDAAPADPRSRYGAVVLEVYGPEPTRFLNYVRTISVVNDGGRWCFDQSGEPFPFERVERYVGRKQDRFTSEMLSDYLDQLGLRPFDESFYLPQGTMASLIRKQGSLPPGLRNYTLAQARSEA